MTELVWQIKKRENIFTLFYFAVEVRMGAVDEGSVSLLVIHRIETVETTRRVPEALQGKDLPAAG